MKILPLVLFSITILNAHSASAHTALAQTVPADGATISAAPESAELRFSAPVRLTALSVQMDGAEKRSLGPLPSEATEQFTVTLPALEPGHYIVSWRAMSEDTHVMSGEFMFTLGPTGSRAEHGETGNHNEHGETD